MSSAGKVTPYIVEFDKVLNSWTDERLISRGDIKALFLFSSYLVNLADAGGWVYYGHSYKASLPLGILVVKATMDDTPVVCFTSGRSFLVCCKVFLRKLDDGVVEWRPDQYR